MKKNDNTITGTEKPYLLISPHVLLLLMELFLGEMQQPHLQQERISVHLTVCHDCRDALKSLLSIVREYDHSNKDNENKVKDELLQYFVLICHEIEIYEARQYERLGAYAEAFVVQGQIKADLCFPDIVAHLKTCSDCCSTADSTITFVIESEHTVQPMESLFYDEV